MQAPEGEGPAKLNDQLIGLGGVGNGKGDGDGDGNGDGNGDGGAPDGCGNCGPCPRGVARQLFSDPSSVVMLATCPGPPKKGRESARKILCLANLIAYLVICHFSEGNHVRSA